MKKIATKTTAVIMMLALMLTMLGMQPTMAAAPSAASARDVYISGNFVEGQTLTAHYAYYDKSGKTEAPDSVKYQWYYYSNTKTEIIAGATQSTFTIPAGSGKKDIFVEITTANADGYGKAVHSNVYYFYAADSAATTPERVRPYMVFVNGDSYMPGATLRATANYAQRAGYDVTPSYEWAVSDDGVKFGSPVCTDEIYTITEDVYGKYLRLLIKYKTTIDGTDYVSGQSYYSCIAKIGSLLDCDTAVTKSTFYNNGYNSIMPLMNPDSGALYTYGNKDVGIKLDVGKVKKFDGIDYRISSSTPTNIKLEYSVDDVTYTTVPAEALAEQNIKLAAPVYARYFKLSYFTPKNSVLYRFYPYLSVNEREVSDILEGTPLDAVVSGIALPEGYAITAVKDADGTPVENTSAIYLTKDNCAKYTVYAAKGDNEIKYTLSCKEAIYTQDYSGADTAKKYISNAIDKTNTRDIYGTKATYWTFDDSESLTNETRPYGQIIEENGNKILKVDANNQAPTDIVFAKLNYEYTVPSATGIYSLSYRIKPAVNSSVNVTAKIGSLGTGKFISSGFVLFDGGMLYACGKFVGSYTPGEWYNVEGIINYDNSTICAYIDGVKYGEAAIAENTGDRNMFSPVIEIRCKTDNNADVNYFDDMAVRQVYDMNTCTAAEAKEYKLLLMSGDAEVKALEGGAVYQAAANVANIVPYYTVAAVFCDDYADDEANTKAASHLIGVYSMSDGGISNIAMPDNIAENYPSGKIKRRYVVKLMAWDSELNPVLLQPNVIE